MSFRCPRQLRAYHHGCVSLVFREVDADAALAASRRRVDIVAGQMHEGLVIALSGFSALVYYL